MLCSIYYRYFAIFLFLIKNEIKWDQGMEMKLWNYTGKHFLTTKILILSFNN